MQEFQIQCRETGDVIAGYNTLEEATEVMNEFIAEDIKAELEDLKNEEMSPQELNGTEFDIKYNCENYYLVVVVEK